jgi:hypothetical protein
MRRSLGGFHGHYNKFRSEKMPAIFQRVAGRENVKKPLEMPPSGWYDGGAFLREQQYFSTNVDNSVEK